MRVLRGLSARFTVPTAITLGNFDGVHRGHQRLLSRLIDVSRLQRLATVVLIFEPQPQEFFSTGSPPPRLCALREKISLLASCGISSVVVYPFNAHLAQLGAEEFVAAYLVGRLNARYILVGDDFKFGARRQGNTETLERLAPYLRFKWENISPVLDSTGQRISSTRIRQRLAVGDLASATEMLGRPYCIGGRVEVGKQLGRLLGFPTANLQLKRERLPLTGIFAATVRGLVPQPLPAAASIGVRPTVEEGGRLTLEAYILNFDENIYRRRISVHLHAKLRDEEKFESLSALMKQMQSDVDQVRRFFRADPVRR